MAEVFPSALQFVSLSKKDVLPNAAGLMKILFFSEASEGRFVSYTETSDTEVSLVLDEDSMAVFHEMFTLTEGSSVTSDTLWSAIELNVRARARALSLPARIVVLLHRVVCARSGGRLRSGPGTL